MPKLKIAIFDLTDCEGCEVEIISLREKLLELAKKVEIVNWRLGQSKNKWGNFDITLVEGTPITQREIDLLKYLREKSKLLIGLGSCATLGGIPAIVKKEERLKWYKKIYGPNYKPRGIEALPLSAYVKVDFLIHGCPINKEELLDIMKDLISGKTPAYRGQSVCYECKLAQNPCRLLQKKPCLGPITQAGCKAVCVSGGSACYGCFGIREAASIQALLKILNRITDQEEIDRIFTMFLRQSPTYQEIKKLNLNGKSNL